MQVKTMALRRRFHDDASQNPPAPNPPATRPRGTRLPFFYGWVLVAIGFVTMAVGVNARTAFMPKRIGAA